MRDYPHMQKNYARARELMARNGNPTQWGDTFPKDDVVRDDIAQRRAMLLVDEVGGHERILAQFALCPGEDPTYHHIDGAWLDDDSYVTIHRIASSGLVKHAARDCIAWPSSITATSAPTPTPTTRPCSTSSKPADSPAAA